MDNALAKEVEKCEVHYHRMADGRCCCPHECADCGTTYRGPNHSKHDCITVLKRRLRLDELAERIKTLEADQKPMSREDLIAAAKADLLANWPKPMRPGTYKDKFGDIRWVGTGEPAKTAAPVTMHCEKTDDHYHEWQPNTPLTEASKCDACGLMATDVMSGLEPSAPATEQTHTECNSRAGIVCGLVDGVIAIARIWNQYIDHPMPDDPAVIAAFKDMRADKDVREFFGISEFEALTADFRADFPASKPSAPATEPDKWNDAKPCGLSGNWCFVHHCYPKTCKIMGLGEYSQPTLEASGGRS